MNIKDVIENLKKDNFDGKSLDERYSAFLYIIKQINKTKKEITKEEIELLKYMVKDQGINNSEINLYYDKLVGSWCEELFNLVVKAKVVETQVNKKESQYDPYILSLHGRHPDEWSVEDLREEMKSDDMQRYFEDE